MRVMPRMAAREKASGFARTYVAVSSSFVSSSPNSESMRWRRQGSNITSMRCGWSGLGPRPGTAARKRDFTNHRGAITEGEETISQVKRPSKSAIERA